MPVTGNDNREKSRAGKNKPDGKPDKSDNKPDNNKSDDKKGSTSNNQNSSKNKCYDFVEVWLFQLVTSIQSLSCLNSSVVFANKFGVKFL